MRPLAIVIKGACLGGLLVAAAGGAAAQPGSGNLVMSGWARFGDGSPARGIKVVCTVKYRPNVLREARTDDQGKWAIPFIKAGTWVTAAFADEMMSELQEVLLTVSRSGVDLVLTRSAADIVIEAKKALYREDLPKTIEILDWFIQCFPRSRERAGAIFWLAYTHNRLGHDETTSWAAVDLRKKALEGLETLIRSYPASEWRDDAEILRVDVALGLYRLGQRRYRDIIEESAAVRDRSRMDVKLAGLEALLAVDGAGAVQGLGEIALKDPESAVRKSAVLILGQSETSEARAMMAEVAMKDPDMSVKKEAQLWLDRRPPGKK